jgi:GT2 family glycosyltransferase
MLYRRDAALELGGYDQAYAPVWLDDLDLTLGMRREGLKVFFTPEVRVAHHVGRDRAARRLARLALPARLRHRLARRLDLRPREQRERLDHHYAYWRSKWGFDLLNPDMEAVIARWGDTELCWRLNPAMREAGEEIVSRFAAAAR